MTQELGPVSTITVGIWLGQDGGTALHTYINSIGRSDTQYIQSSLNSTGLCEVALAAGGSPAVSTGHILRYTYNRSVSNKDYTLVVRLMQGVAEIASWTHANPPLSFTLAEQTLTTGQADAITDYSDLRIQFDVTVASGGGGRMAVSWARFYTPDAATSASVLDGVSISESVASTVSDPQTAVSDSIGVAESVNVSIEGGTLEDLEVSVSDSINVNLGVPIPSLEADLNIGYPGPYDEPLSASKWSGSRPVIPPGEEGEWDLLLWGGAMGSVIKVGSTYYLYYVGADNYDEINETVENRAIGVATSEDGVNWTKYSGNPIVTFDTGGSTEEGAANPTVIHDGSTWHMWYSASIDTGGGLVDVSIRYRTSTDGLTWTGDVEEYLVSTEEHIPIGVFKEGSTYYLYYIGPLAGGNGALRYMQGTTPGSLGSNALIDTGPWKASRSFQDLDATTISVVLAEDTPAWELDWRTIDRSTPGTISTEIAQYGFTNHTGPSLYLDKTRHLWMLYTFMGGGGTYDGYLTLRTAPAASTVPDSILILEITTLALDDLQVSVSDTVTVGESTLLAVVDPGVTAIIVSDSITVTDIAHYYDDLIVVTESVAVSIEGVEATLSVSVSDAVGVAESVDLAVSDPQVSVSDAVGVAEAASIESQTTLAVSDSVGIAENVLVAIQTGVIASDSISVAEDVAILTTTAIGVSDAVAVAESVALEITLEIDVSESISITESVEVATPLQVSVSDAVAVDESVDASTTTEVSVSDSVLVSEAVNVLAVEAGATNVSASDAVSVAENVTISLDDLEVVASDAIGVAESVALTVTVDVVASDSVTIAELVTIASEDTLVAVTDTVAVAEAVSISTETGVVAEDTVSVTESVEVTTGDLALAVSDSVGVSESVSVLVVSPIAVSDEVTVAESVSIATGDLQVVVSDAVLITESANVTPVEAGATNVNVSDAITVSENVSLSVPAPRVDVTDSVSVAENVSALVEALVAVTDAVTVSESVALVVEANVSVSDAVAVAESVGVSTSAPVSASDSVSVGESVAAEVSDPQVAVSDAVSVAEIVNVTPVSAGDTNATVDDTVTVSESVTLEVGTEVVVSDTVEVDEVISVAVGAPGVTLLATSDTVLVGESVAVATGDLEVNVSDAISVADVASANVPDAGLITISVSDTVAVSENVTVSLGAPADLSFSVEDAVVVAEVTDVDSFISFAVVESVVVSDSFDGYTVLVVVAEDTVVVTDGATIEPLAIYVSAQDTVSVADGALVQQPGTGGIKETLFKGMYRGMMKGMR